MWRPTRPTKFGAPDTIQTCDLCLRRLLRLGCRTCLCVRWVQILRQAWSEYRADGNLEAESGVFKVAASYEDKTATIVYDDVKADVNQLTSANTPAGYPSAPKG